MASSSSSSSIPRSHFEYDVFLNFRGTDVRNNFISYLYDALCKENVNTFIDSEKFEKGQEISKLLDKIEESRISIMVFSPDYASSPWCLVELVKIMECRKKRGQIAIPIFYHTEPTIVKRQTGSFEQAFHKHESNEENRTKVPGWRAALKEAATLSGFVLRTDRPEAKELKDIVKVVLEKKKNFDKELEAKTGQQDRNDRFSPISQPQWRNDVFLSHTLRADARNDSFVKRLCEALCERRVPIAIDEEKFDSKKKISEIFKEIEESKIFIVVISKDYASSELCLEELGKIMDCSKRHGQRVIPVFYHVIQHTVGSQSGSFGEPLRRRETVKGNLMKVQGWRAALNEAAKVPGWLILENHGESIEELSIIQIAETVARTLH